MADELVFPPNNTLSLMEDIGTNMMNEEALANDINPSFPQCEIINIPEIIPPIISMKDRQKTFQQSSSHTDTPYTPISQLMKQTEELAATLDGPLNSNINEQINFNNLQNNSNVQDPMNMQNPLVNNSINFANSNSHTQNTQCLVIRGQRIPITSQSQHSSSVINIKHAPNANSPLAPTCSQHTMHSNSVINASNNLKQTITKTSPNQQPNKPPMKGQIIKTSDQRLMFVTEVNGKRVGYLIQQPKQPNAPQTSQTPSQNVLNQHFDNRRNQDASDVKNDNKTEPTNTDIDNHKSSNSESINFTLDENKEIVMTHSENISKVNTEPLIKTDMKLLREKLLNLRNPLNLKNQLNLKSPLSFPTMNKTLSKKLDSSEELCNEKTEEVNPIAQVVNPVSAAVIPSIHSYDASPIPSPDSPNGSIDNMENSNEFMSSHCDEMQNNEKNNYNVGEMQDEEEEGQEIEFSENDLTADFDDNPHESVSPDYEIGENDINNDELGHSSGLRMRATSTDDEDSVPLALLKNDMYDTSLSPSNNNQAENNIVKPKKVKNNKKSKQSKKDCISLSLVAASLKKGENEETDGKSKKKAKTKSKKKKDDRKPTRPIPAYQLFFRDVQHDIREQNPQLNFGEISKVVSQKWETLEEMQKKKYQDMNEVAKVEYNEKFKVYKELIAREEACGIFSPISPTSTPEFNQADQADSNNQTEENNDGEEGTPKRKKKKAGKRKRSKKSPVKKKAFTFDETKDDINEHIEGKDDETIPAEAEAEISKKTNSRPRKQTKTHDKEDDNPPSSPSLPSSSSSEDDEDSETAITRIRERAAELHKYLKQQRKVVTQKKSKQSGEKLRTIKIEAETLSEIPEDLPVIKDSLNDEVQTDIKMEEDVNDSVVGKEMEDNAMDEEIGDTAMEEDLSCNAEEEDLQDTLVKEKPDKANEKTSSKSINDERSSSSGNEDEEQLVVLKRKRSTRVKKVLEEVTIAEEDSLKIRKKRSQALKNRLEETSKSDSDEESTCFKRKKSTRKRKLDKSKSGIEEELSNSKDMPTKVKINENDEPSKSESEEESTSLKELSSRLKEKGEAELQSIKQETTTSPMDSPTNKTDEIKKEDETSSEPSPEPSPLKNTFRIPKKSNTENGLLALQGPRICIRQTCQNPAKSSRERGGQYCGNECLVMYCREVFESWVLDREVEEKNKT